jgi:hypothetical protein
MMSTKAKVVLTDYVWESPDVERTTLDGLAELVPLQSKDPVQMNRLPLNVVATHGVRANG